MALRGERELRKGCRISFKRKLTAIPPQQGEIPNSLLLSNLYRLLLFRSANFYLIKIHRNLFNPFYYSTLSPSSFLRMKNCLCRDLFDRYLHPYLSYTCFHLGFLGQNHLYPGNTVYSVSHYFL